MNTDQVKSFFEFSKRERRGFLTILFITFCAFVLPTLLSMFKKNSVKKADEGTLAKLAELIKLADTNTSNQRIAKQQYKDFESGRFRDRDPSDIVHDKSIKGELFYFDPNTIDEQGWQKLGVSQKTATTIINFKSKGGKFFQPDDIGKIYGLSDEMVERLMPFVKIEKVERNYAQRSNTEPKTFQNNNTQNTVTPNNRTATTKTSASIDVNTADTIAWKSLPGIGSKLSARIVNYRNKLGGFYTVQQVGETFGLPDSTFQKIKSQLLINPSTISFININTATIEQLNNHPYINKSLANNIVQYRTQHGNYNSEADLRKLALFNDEIWQKIKPYITY